MLDWQDLSEGHVRWRLNKAFYDQVRAAKPRYKLIEQCVIPPHSGRGFRVKQGQTFRVIEESGPQIAAVSFWNADDPRETFLAATSWPEEGVFLRLYSRLFSGLPWRRPMMTCIEDTVVTEPTDSVFHHHFIGTHCSPELMEMRYGVAALNGCRINLLRAIEPFGLKEEDLHDSISVHQKAYLDSEYGKIWTMPSDARAGDYVEFFAEVNLIVGVSVCPFGDGARRPPDGDHDVRPLRVEVYETGTIPHEFPKWTDWRPTWRGKWMYPESLSK